MLLSLSSTALLLLSPAWLPSGHRWSTSDLPVPYCLTANSQNTSLSANAQRTQVLNAINQWRATGVGGSMSCTIYDAAPDSRACTARRNANDGMNNIFWQRNWNQGSGTIGVTWSVFAGNCGSVTDDTGQNHSLDCSIDSDIEFNDVHYTWESNGTETDIATIAVHEYGHFIGLDHCDSNNTCQIGTGVMYAAYPGGTIRVPFNDDVQGGCGLYPGTPGGLGWPCNAAGQCSGAPICVNPAAGGYCTQTCGTCPTGYICSPNPQNPAQMVCLRDDGLNRGLCEVCQGGLPNACANNGICVSGIPETNMGRCAIPCPNPAQPMGGCPNLYGCFRVSLGGGGSGDYCLPRSQDCTNLNNIQELQLGQSCGSGSPPCASGLDCIGICSPTCTGGPGQGSCPAGYACETFQFQGGTTEDYCAPAVNEGQSCEGVKACTVGPCLVSGQGLATCYRTCAGNPAACNNAQTCNTYSVGGGTVSICEPPGVPPRPDAGVPDTGVVVTPDAGGCACDTSAACESGCACDPNCGNLDAGVGVPDTGVIPSQPDSGVNNAQVCRCDRSYACDDSCACDPECNCECDTTTACTEGCDCDPECTDVRAACSGCTSAGAPGQFGAWTALLLLGLGIGLLGMRRYLG